MPASKSAVLLSIFARWPEPGAAKTRLIPAYGEDGSARIYRKLLQHTIKTAQASGLDFELRVTGAEPERFRAAFGSDLAVVEQGDGDLSDKLARVQPPAIVIGSDCPGLTAELLGAASDALDKHTAVIGPASDGGYYLFGFREDVRFAFENMEWSTETVFATTIERLDQHGIAPLIMPERTDIDEAADLADWPDFLP